ncbi:helix-turn-helix domain-containing protein [Subtercola boreus]|nr:helix-turn-helix transcriptional regulator [Subtercola boreus]
MSLIEEVRAMSALPRPESARRIREAAGVSQSRLGQELGVTKKTVSRWENGLRAPRGPNRIAYAALLANLVEVA